MDELSRFPYPVLRDAIDGWFAETGRHHTTARLAWAKLKALAGVVACVEYDGAPGGDGDHDRDALAWAWEDIAMAFRGFGDNTLTGPILQMWHFLPRRELSDLCDRIDRCLVAIGVLCRSSGIQQRYPARYRTEAVPRDPNGFKEPIALPVGGRFTRSWARDEGHDPVLMEEVIQQSLLAAEVHADLDGVDAAITSATAAPRPSDTDAVAEALRAGFYVVPLDPPGEC